MTDTTEASASAQGIMPSSGISNQDPEHLPAALPPTSCEEPMAPAAAPASAHPDMRARRRLCAMLKGFAVNERHQCHQKGKDGLSLDPRWRVSISLNDEGESLLAHPPIQPGIEDKILLLKIANSPMPMPTRTAEEQAAFRTAIASEIPAFIAFLVSWQIPCELVAPRTGLVHFQHPDLLEALRETTPEIRLLELIDEYFRHFPIAILEGTANQIARRLTQEQWIGWRDAQQLLHSPVVVGRYLVKLW